MRRKSTRNAQKATPDKTIKEAETPPKTRRSRRRKRSPSKSSESEDEVLVVKKPTAPEQIPPDTTTKSHPPTDEEGEEPTVWKVTTESPPKGGEIQKLKISLTRPSPDSHSPDKSKSRRSKSNSQTEDDATSSEDKSTRRTRSHGSPVVRSDGLSSQDGDEDVEEKKGKGKSKGKHKSKIEKSPQLSEPETQTNNEISENVQVTPQSPSIDKPVDNENDYNKVDADDIQNVNESIQTHENNSEESAKNTGRDSDNEQLDKDVAKDSEDDKPLSTIQKTAAEKESKTINIQLPSEESQETATEAAEERTVESSTSQDLPAETEEAEDLTIEAEKLETAEQSSPKEVEKDVEQKSPEKVQTNEEVMEVDPEQQSAKEDEQKLPTENVEREDNASTENVEKADKSDTSCENVATMDTSVTEESMESSLPSAKAVEATQQNDIERPPRLKLIRNNEYPKENIRDNDQDDTEETCHARPSKIKRKWDGSSKSTSSVVKIDLESLQGVWPTIDFPEEPDLHVEVEKERRRSVTADSSAKKLERKVSVEYKSDTSERRPSFEKQSSVSSANQDSEDNSNIIAFNRKISIVDDTASKLKPPPSPAKNPLSNILYITNLVRPFTVKQLKELLERTGKIQEDGFWTDRIKSKCYVQYETQEEAEATRNALHGVQWPIGNGKKLIIDYATEEEMNNARNPPVPPPAAPVPEVKATVKENLQPLETKPRPEEKSTKEVEKRRAEGPVREWDIGKKDVRRERSRSRERNRKHRRSPSPHDDFISRKQRKAEESVPQKLMDDLFLKTKTTPSIYWQPLSPEEIAMKQQQRLIRMEEHKRRMEENSRMKGREMGRGVFRRRYD